MYHKLHVMGVITHSELDTSKATPFLRVDLKIVTKKEEKTYPCIFYQSKFSDLSALQKLMAVGKTAVVIGTPIVKKEEKTVITGINVTEYPSVDSDEKINLIGWVGKFSIDTNSQTQEKFLNVKIVVKPYKDTDSSGKQNEYWYTLFINSNIVNIDKVFTKLKANKLIYAVGIPRNKVITWNGKDVIQRGCIVTEMPLFLN